jgi:trigger factor
MPRRWKKALKEQRRNTTWPGFRPGQVPMSIVKKRVGRALLVNEVERLVSQSLNEYIRSNQLRVLGQPLPRNESVEGNNWEEPGDFNFSYEMGMAPAFDVDLANLGVEMPVVDLTDDMVNREMTDLQRRYGQLEDAEVSEAHDMLLGDLIEINEEGTPKEGGLMGRTTISLEFLKDEGTRQQLTGLKKGAEVKVDPHKVSDGHDDLARMLHVDHARVHDLHGEMLFRVAEIKRHRADGHWAGVLRRVYRQGRGEGGSRSPVSGSKRAWRPCSAGIRSGSSPSRCSRHL